MTKNSTAKITDAIDKQCELETNLLDEKTNQYNHTNFLSTLTLII